MLHCHGIGRLKPLTSISRALLLIVGGKMFFAFLEPPVFLWPVKVVVSRGRRVCKCFFARLFFDVLQKFLLFSFRFVT
jgi:hypothetical protein